MVAEKIVYIVDDDVDVRRSLEHLLKSTGFRAISYAAPLEFLEVAAGLPAPHPTVEPTCSPSQVGPTDHLVAPEQRQCVVTELAFAGRRVRLEAVRACSFFTTPQAAEIALEALNHPSDKYLKYTLDEGAATIRYHTSYKNARGTFPYAAFDLEAQRRRPRAVEGSACRRVEAPHAKAPLKGTPPERSEAP